MQAWKIALSALSDWKMPEQKPKVVRLLGGCLLYRLPIGKRINLIKRDSPVNLLVDK